MGKDNMMEFEGVVEEFANGKFKIRINDNYTALCTLSGKMRQSAIRVIAGDKVKIEVSAYDTKLGRITYRIK